MNANRTNSDRRARRAPAAWTAPALLALALCAAPAGAALDPRYDPARVAIPSLNPIRDVKPERSVLSNGMVLYLLADRTLPVVRGQMYVKASSLSEPADKVGLGGLTGEVMRSGGSATKAGDWLDDRLAAIGASVSSFIGSDNAGASFRCLTENTDEVLGLLAEVVRRPAFPEDKIELERVSLRRQIAGRNDELFEVLQRVSGYAVYGKDSPYARLPEYATVEAIGREDCVKMHAQCFVPNRTVLVVYGDFEPGAMKKLVARHFADWKRDDTPAPPLPPLPARGSPRVVFAPKDDVTQSAVVLTHLGFRADSPDYADMEVLQRALGGGFNSRLFNRVRTVRGLAYATGATSGAGFLRPGIFFGYSLTRNDSVMTALDLVREEVVRVTREPVTEDELRIARDGAMNSFVFNFEQPSSVAFRAGFYEMAGYPQDFLQRYQKALAGAGAASMLAAARRQIEPDKLVTVIVGKESEFDRPLNALGLPVERVDITIPPPPPKARVPAATPEVLAKGRQWLERAAELTGGAAAWAAVKSWSSSQKLNVSMQGQSIAMEVDMSWALPERHLSVQKTPMGEMAQGYDGTTGWARMFGKVQDNPRAAGAMKEEYERSLFRLFGKPADVTIQALPASETVDGVAYSVAFVKSEKMQDWMLYFAPDGRLARMEFMGAGPTGPGKQSVIYSDWKPVGSIQYPHAVTMLVDGKPFMESSLAQARVNPELAPELFRKPAE